MTIRLPVFQPGRVLEQPGLVAQGLPPGQGRQVVELVFSVQL